MSLDLTYFLFYWCILSLQVSLLMANRTSFFVSFKKPHNVVTSKTLSRWICSLLTDAGVDTTLFQPHSTRSAAGVLLSKALSSIELCKLADWSSRSGTYEKFYQRFLWGFHLFYALLCQVPTAQINIKLFDLWLIEVSFWKKFGFIVFLIIEPLPENVL